MYDLGTYLRSNNISARQFSRVSGVSDRTIRDICKGYNKKVLKNTAEKICVVIGIEYNADDWKQEEGHRIYTPPVEPKRKGHPLEWYRRQYYVGMWLKVDFIKPETRGRGKKAGVSTFKAPATILAKYENWALLEVDVNGTKFKKGYLYFDLWNG